MNDENIAGLAMLLGALAKRGMTPRIQLVIVSDELTGRGTDGDPARVVTTYYTLDGELLARGPDPCATSGEKR